MLGGRGPSAVALRRQEAQRIRYLDAPASRAELPESTWTSPVPWAALAFWALALICLWLLAVDMIAWAVTGKQNWFNPAAGPPDAVGWGSIVFLVAMAAVVTAVVLPLVLQRPWMRLDSTDLTHRSRGFPRMKRPTAYRWADCGPFTVVRVPGGEGGTVRVVRCTHADGPFTVDGNFGDPDDVAAILNAYRLAYGGSRGAERGGPEPSSTDLADRTWTASRRGGLAPLIVFAVCGGLMAPMFAYATGPRDQAWFFMTVVLAPIGIILASRLYYVVSPPWLRLDSTGVTIGGARRAWPSPQQVHRWEDCGPFTSVEDSTVQCRLAQGTLTLRAEDFDYRGDLAAELNAYRRVYGSIELS